MQNHETIESYTCIKEQKTEVLRKAKKLSQEEGRREEEYYV